MYPLGHIVCALLLADWTVRNFPALKDDQDLQSEDILTRYSEVVSPLLDELRSRRLVSWSLADEAVIFDRS